MTIQNNNKPKKLNNQCRTKQSPTRTLQAVNDQIACSRVAGVQGATMATSRPGNQDLRDDLTFGNLISRPTSNRIMSTVTNNNMPPPPNATVVVCILAGTGRADLWLRNNRGQTPLDLCPADQPLRRALIRCCDAAARTRSAQAAAAVTTTRMSLLPDLQLQLLNNMPHTDYLNKAPCRETYDSLIVADPTIPQECSKTIASCTNSSFLNNQNNLIDMCASIDLEYPSPTQVLPNEDTTTVSTTGSDITMPFTSTTVTLDNNTKSMNSIDYDDNRYF